MTIIQRIGLWFLLVGLFSWFYSEDISWAGLVLFIVGGIMFLFGEDK